MDYSSWRISFQDSEQAAKAAYKELNEAKKLIYKVGSMCGDPISCEESVKNIFESVSEYLKHKQGKLK